MRMRSASCPGISPSEHAMYGQGKKVKTATRVPKFLRCLYDILHNEDHTVLCWAKDGSHFQIMNTKRLETEVLPKYFKHGKFASFQRQLNNFGFRKWTKTQSNVCTFSHHHFVRRHPQQLVELVIQQDQEAAKTENANANIASTTTECGKRKRENECTNSDAPMAKILKPASFHQFRPTPMLKNEQSAFDFEVESWNITSDIAPLEWASKAQPIMIKMEPGNETPTSAANFGEVGFDFTLEELDDILYTTSNPAHTDEEGEDMEQQHLDIRLLSECYALPTGGPPSHLAWEPEMFCKTELDLYMQDPDIWTAH